MVSFPGENGFNKGLDEPLSGRLPKVGQVNVNIQQTSPLFLDSFQTINGKRDNGFLTGNDNVDTSLVFRPFDFTPASEKELGVQLSDAEITVVKKKESIPNTQDSTYDTIADNNIAGVEFIGKQDRTSNLDLRRQGINQGMELMNPDNIVTHRDGVSLYLQTAKTQIPCRSDSSGPEVIKLFSCSTQLSMKFFLLINLKCQRLLTF